ncbi:MAG: LysM peptidoglycan-binding domain-containing M23 family metallopeptidase, partial [Actinomycetota bacterium]|nr:LysM peptidoglycan-binding domain-containing M23 family metallopeptidase [Actinomycetota bacterium]
VQQIVQANGIVDPGLIFAGTRLRLEGPAWSAPPVEGRRTHVVQAEETLSGIALRYGTTVQAIVEANAIPDPSLIVVGTSLEVPTQALVCPVPGATFFNDWGFVRPGGRFHEGNDLYAPHGTPVLANVSGLVEHLEGPTGGLQYRLYAGDGTTYVGTHLSGFGAAGSVQAGEVIGYVGDSGNARGSRPHLHFEIIPPGSDSINPYPFLEKACP